MNNYGLVFVLLFLIWMLLAGSVSIAVLLLGLAVTFLGLWGFGRSDVYRTGGERVSSLMWRLWNTLVFLVIFLGEVFRSAIGVARFAYQPIDRMRPGVIRVKTILRSRTAITVLANLISLTPGTLTMDFNSDEWAYYVHWIDVTTLDEDERAEALIQNMEEHLRRVLE